MTRCLVQRLWTKIQEEPDGCWRWVGAIDHGTGYGRITTADKIDLAHRVTYELFIGPIPDGHDLDHLCRHRWCVRPGHLEPVTRRENLLRGETLTAAHHEGRDCGFAACRACRRFRVAEQAEAAS